MPFSLVPVAATPISAADLMAVFFAKRINIADVGIKSYLKCRDVFLVDSGITAFLLILKALIKKEPDKNEVILPAYTAPRLILPLKKLNLKPVFCDISLENFSLDASLLPALINSRTLAVLYVYSFAIADEKAAAAFEKFPDTLFIEDCAQSLGTLIDSVSVGNSSQVSINSFNRGKNITSFQGGCVCSNSRELSKQIQQEFLCLQKPSVFSELKLSVKILGLAVAVNPYIYARLYSLLHSVKKRIDNEGLYPKTLGFIQKRLLSVLINKADRFAVIRFENGKKIISGLSGLKGLLLPKISQNTRIAFNRLPIVFQDKDKLTTVERQLFSKGIEANRMYEKTLPQIEGVDNPSEKFPCAAFASEHLLTLPVHPFIKEKDIKTMVTTIRSILK